MMKVFAAVLLLLLILSVCHSEVVKSFKSTCPQFFAKPYGFLKSSPTIFPGCQYKQICQIRDNTHEFATLYDTKNKIPVYSAYRFKGRRICERPTNIPWYIEPQLNNQNEKRTMDSDETIQQLPNQAVNADYVRSGYHKGHLVPVHHAKEDPCAEATFTLTNAAPQNGPFNSGQWRVAEGKVARFLESACKGYKVYIVTGVTPSKTKFIKERVNVPSHFWSGFCCLDQNDTPKLSGGFYGENQNDPVTYVSLDELEIKLTGLFGRYFRLFSGLCNIQRKRSLIMCMNRSKNQEEPNQLLDECAREIRDANKNCRVVSNEKWGTEDEL